MLTIKRAGAFHVGGFGAKALPGTLLAPGDEVIAQHVPSGEQYRARVFAVSLEHDEVQLSIPAWQGGMMYTAEWKVL